MRRPVSFAIIFVTFLLGGVFILPWSRVNWGKIEFLPASTVTVSGEAKREDASQMATFSAGITITDPDQNVATDKVNEIAGQLIQSVKDFGIPDEDIQTQNVSIFQVPSREILPFGQPGQDDSNQWRVSNSIEITLRNPDRAGELADLLAETEATSVNGPRFSLDNTQSAQIDLLQSAIEDARLKAQKIAVSSDMRLGKIITVTEGNAPLPVFRALEAGQSGTPIEPGTETVSKTVTVVFELK